MQAEENKYRARPTSPRQLNSGQIGALVPAISKTTRERYIPLPNFSVCVAPLSRTWRNAVQYSLRMPSAQSMRSRK